VRAVPVRRTRSRGPMLAVALLLVVAIVGVAGGAARYFSTRASGEAQLTNARVNGMGLAMTLQVDYHLRDKPDPAYRYFFTVKNRQTGQNEQFWGVMLPEQRGTLNFPLFRPLAPMSPRAGHEMFLERESVTGLGKRERCSNVITATW
jgi:type II secretory pathway pseudopilin PulG